MSRGGVHCWRGCALPEGMCAHPCRDTVSGGGTAGGVCTAGGGVPKGMCLEGVCTLLLEGCALLEGVCKAGGDVSGGNVHATAGGVCTAGVCVPVSGVLVCMYVCMLPMERAE